MGHKSGFVNIIGEPNVGKSTLMNALVGERMSIITSKPQTTRHRILGIVNDEGYQVVFSDTPGIIKDPSYKMQESMNRYVKSSFEDADLILYLIDPSVGISKDVPFLKRYNQSSAPKFLIINKIDQHEQSFLKEAMVEYSEHLSYDQHFFISALEKINTEFLLESVIEKLPEGPAYYPKDQFTDRPERFFVSEIIREKILELYRQEIPYSCEVIIDSFKEGTSKNGPIIRIRAEIYVSRQSQKAIVIGKNGQSIKKLGELARKDIQVFLDSAIFLELYVRVKDNWRDDERALKHFGYLK